MYGEAINTYGLIVKNKQYPQAGRLRINMGNIHFEERKYGQVSGAGQRGCVLVQADRRVEQSSGAVCMACVAEQRCCVHVSGSM